MSEPQTIIGRLFTWLETQGTSTVLLVAIAAFLYVNLPDMTAKLDEGYRRNAEQLQRSFETQEKTIDRIMRYIEREEFPKPQLP